MRFTVVVPERANLDNAALMEADLRVVANPHFRASVLKDVEEMIAERFGGFTEYSAFGGWTGPDGVLVREPVTVVETFGDDTAVNHGTIETCRHRVGYGLYQDAAMSTAGEDAVFFEINWKE